MAEELSPSAVLIDLDGTLVDTLPALRAALTGFLKEHGKEPGEAEFERWDGAPLSAIVEGLARDHGIPGSPDVLLGRYRRTLTDSYVSTARPLPGAFALLDEARARGARVAVVTSAPRDLADGVLAAAEIAPDVVVSGDDVAIGKPDPAGYRQALRATGSLPTRAVALEDSVFGVAAATAAGLRCIAVGRSEPKAWASAMDLHRALPLIVEVLEGRVRAFGADRVEIRVDDSEQHRSPAEQEEIRARWEAATDRNAGLFDGALLSVSTWSRKEDVLLIDCRVAQYRELIAERGGLSLGVWPLGVAAVTTVDGRMILGKRSADVTQYPGRWELVPSGTLPIECADNPVMHVLDELCEEADLTLGAPNAISLLGLLEDLGGGVFDLCYRIDLKPPVEPVGGDEYDEMHLASLDEVRGLLAGKDPVVSTLAPMLDLLEGVAVS